MENIPLQLSEADASSILQDNAAILIEKMLPFRELMMIYDCALKEVRTKFDVLSAQLSLQQNHNPVENIKSRLKSPNSIMEKLNRRGLPLTVQSIRENLFDVAGVRVVCTFVQDIYVLSDMFLRQDDIKLLQKKDYIRDPKDNGYRSLHLIVEIPIFLTDRTEHVCVEVQFRTIAMDFWASLEHKTKYKKDVKNAELISAELKACADQIAQLDLRMQGIHKFIRIEEELDLRMQAIHAAEAEDGE